jgi:hypothetical protein
MAPKSSYDSKKRKAAPTALPERNATTKKAKVGSLRKPFDRDGPSSDSDGDDAFGSLSDGDADDGGAPIEQQNGRKKLSSTGRNEQRKPGPKGKGQQQGEPQKAKVFEKGRLWNGTENYDILNSLYFR